MSLERLWTAADEDNVLSVVRSNKSSMHALMRMASGDSRTFYIGANLSGADLTGQSLHGLNFEGANFEGAFVDAKTSFDVATYLNPTLRVNYLQISRSSIMSAPQTRKKDLFQFFIRSAGLLENERIQPKGHASLDMNLSERNITFRVRAGVSSLSDLSARAYRDAMAMKMMLSFVELFCFAKFLASSGIQYPHSLEQQFAVWQRKKFESAYRAQGFDHIDLPTTNPDGSPFRYCLIEVAHLLLYFRETNLLSESMMVSAMATYVDQIRSMGSEAVFRDFFLVE